MMSKRETMKQSNNMEHPLYDEILVTAQMFFQDQGFDQTTVWDICSSLQISITQFFTFFDSLDEILEILWTGESVYTA